MISQCVERSRSGRNYQSASTDESASVYKITKLAYCKAYASLHMLCSRLCLSLGWYCFHTKPYEGKFWGNDCQRIVLHIQRCLLQTRLATLASLENGADQTPICIRIQETFDMPPPTPTPPLSPDPAAPPCCTYSGYRALPPYAPA